MCHSVTHIQEKKWRLETFFAPCHIRGMDLRKWRKERRITQAQLARLLGVSRMSIIRYERDGIPRDRRTMLNLALDALDRKDT